MTMNKLLDSRAAQAAVLLLGAYVVARYILPSAIGNAGAQINDAIVPGPDSLGTWLYDVFHVEYGEDGYSDGTQPRGVFQTPEQEYYEMLADERGTRGPVQ